MNSGVLIIFLFSILIIGLISFGIIMITKKTGRALNVEKYQTRWLAIESSLNKNQPNSFSLAILNADKLVDAALKEKGIAGNTMGDRLRTAKNTWTNADHIWGAHKIRNKIAHETDFIVNYETAARSLVAYKKALKDLGAI